ncbi:DUF3747 domain-containing protein [Fischerella sp. PCC 9605]|uniref:DUF3747 domain-containing protein n=1 Tax=Fischerella sp. PCC 9605 TaxID=1173024 RepID=UPI00047D1ACF|nr:DUF3747 domain-containing protein [Fischerella sp. PCC 9605]
MKINFTSRYFLSTFFTFSANFCKIKIIKDNDQFLLVGISNTDPNAPAIKIGSTHGIGKGLTKIQLEPGWYFTKRTYNGQTTGHIYLTSDRPAPGEIANQQQTRPIGVNQIQQDSPQLQNNSSAVQNNSSSGHNSPPQGL